MPDLLSRLQAVFRDVLDAPGLQLTRASNPSNVPGWDSLAQLNIIVAVEQEFGVSFTLAELAEMDDVGEMLDLMQQKLQAAGSRAAGSE